MEPLLRPQATLVDLLERVLDRGLIINADIIISLAGVPLIGVNLRAALAGMETMRRYGLMEEWDETIRGRAMNHVSERNDGPIWRESGAGLANP